MIRTRKFLGILALGAAASSALMVPTAGAQELPDITYAASSSGEALRLSVFGNELTVGRTVSGLDSALNAAADGVGITSPLFDGGASTAQVAGSGEDGSMDEVCEGSTEDIPGLSIGLACSSSHAAVIDGVPSSVATGRVGSLSINPVQTLLDTPLSEVVEPVLEGAEDGVDQLLDGLRPVTTGVDEALGLGLEDTLDDLFGALFGGADLVSISLGTTIAQNTVSPNMVGAKCTSAGGRIDVLDLPALAEGLDPEPVLSLIIGDAGAAVDVDTTTTEATPTINPAIVTVIAPSLGLNVPVGPGETVEIPLPEPFGSSTVQVADGTTSVDENGQTVATANAVLIDLLNGEAMQGGVELALASCTAVAGSTITQIPTTTTTTTPALPRTGGGAPNTVALMAAMGLAGLGVTLLRRTAAPTV